MNSASPGKPQNYILASSQGWGVDAFRAARSGLQGNWTVVVGKADLAPAVEAMQPRYVFFPHWSDIVPSQLLERFECVCFHMTDVPYGRGGSPLQNLIARGHRETVLTALRMTAQVDAGPVYLKRPLRLAGSARAIFRRAGMLAMEMVAQIAEEEPEPSPQQGEVTVFRRRKPAESVVPTEIAPARLYDHIRMLDAPGYPHAFIEHGDWRAEFTDAELAGDAVEARVRFSRRTWPMR